MFIYCIDAEYKQKLIDLGLRFVKEEKIGDTVVYLFAQGDKLNFDELDQTKVFKSQMLKFEK